MYKSDENYVVIFWKRYNTNQFLTLYPLYFHFYLSNYIFIFIHIILFVLCVIIRNLIKFIHILISNRYAYLLYKIKTIEKLVSHKYLLYGCFYGYFKGIYFILNINCNVDHLHIWFMVKLFKCGRMFFTCHL